MFDARIADVSGRLQSSSDAKPQADKNRRKQKWSGSQAAPLRRVRSVPAVRACSVQANASFDRGESESVAAKASWYQAWDDPDSSRFASFAGSVNHPSV